ncbi:kinase-like domain-containing protein, partial [Pisolithus marmoratus]
GDIFHAWNILTGTEVTVKLRHSEFSRALEHECNIYKSLTGGPGILQLYWFSTDYGFHAMVVEHLGSSLQDLVSRSDHKFNIDIITGTGLQMITCLEFMHVCDFIHHDIKLLNFLTEVDFYHNLLIDFGHAHTYRDHKTHCHVHFQEHVPFIGTKPFTSVNAHSGIELSHHDDIKSLAYTLIYLLNGSLPWDHSVDSCEILQAKLDFTRLTYDIPMPFLSFLEHAQALSFSAKPDYKLLQSHLKQCSDYMF